MTTIAVVNRKGGVGKTTVAVTLADGLRRRGKRVGLIDTDSQGHCALMLGQPERDGLYNVLVNGHALADELLTVPAAWHPDLYLLPSAEMTHRISRDIDETASFSFVELVDRFRDQYALDVVVIDTNPTLSQLDALVWMAVDQHLYVVECERMAFDGVSKAIEQVRRFAGLRSRYLQRETRIMGIVPNKMVPRTVLHRHNISMLADAYGTLVWGPIIKSVGWAEAAQIGQTIFEYAPDSQACRDARALVIRASEAMAWPE